MEKSLLRLEAERIVEELNLLELLGRFGEARIVGNVALDLIVKRDIDVHVVVPDHNLSGIADCIRRELLKHEKVNDVHITDYRENGGLKVGIEVYPRPSGGWSIDIWITDRPETTGFALVDRLNKILTPEQRASILLIKQHFHERGQLCDSMSTRIYEAVVDKGIRSIEEFEVR